MLNFYECRLDPYTIMADYVGAAINSPMLAYEGSPTMTLMEKEVLETMCNVTGYPTCDGSINDGGSFSNMIGMALARCKKYPEVQKRGNDGTKEMVLFISDDAHYSFNK
jgi:glutamate/tyrosine decarboxylase-like PLP-dependent enzyme